MIEPGVPIIITENQLRQIVSDEDIARMYIPNFEEVNKSFKSDERNDRNPSCRVFDKKGTGILWFKDFGNPTLKALNMIEYVMYRHNISNRQEAVNRIYQDLKKRKGSISLKSELTSKGEAEYSVSQLVFKIKRRAWTKYDIKYWSSYHIPIEMLDRNNIYSISHLWLEKDNRTIFYTEFSKTHLVYSYDYYWNEGIFRRKIYRPELKNQYKWMTNTDYTVVQNVDNIPKTGDLLFSQSSFKDCMVMEVLGYYSIAPNSEGVWYPSYYWEKIKKRWNKIVIFGNNDWDKENNPGLAYAKMHSEMYDVPYIINPDHTTSDIAAYVKRFGLDEGKKLVNKLLEGIL